MTEETAVKDDSGDDGETLIRVQHAVVIQMAGDIRALNDLLSVGWRAISSAPLGPGVLVILERTGSREAVEEMRAALGYPASSDDDSESGSDTGDSGS